MREIRNGIKIEPCAINVRESRTVNSVNESGVGSNVPVIFN